MKYLINSVIILILILVLLVINMLSINSNKVSEKLKRLVKNAIYIILMILLNAGILFIIFQLILSVFNIDLYCLDLMLIAIYGILIVSIGDYTSRGVLRKITENNFSKKYGGINLTEEEMKEIYIRNKRSFFCWKYIFNFLISGLAYSIITDFILQESNLLIIGLISLTSVIFYEVLVKKIIYK